jgi:hypothetical protein
MVMKVAGGFPVKEISGEAAVPKPPFKGLQYFEEIRLFFSRTVATKVVRQLGDTISVGHDRRFGRLNHPGARRVDPASRAHAVGWNRPPGRTSSSYPHPDCILKRWQPSDDWVRCDRAIDDLAQERAAWLFSLPASLRQSS